MTPDRVLVTGGSGYIGRWVLRHFRDTHPGAVLWATGGEDVSLAPLTDRYDMVDLCDAEAVRSLLEACNPSMIVHLAGRIAPGSLAEHLEVNAVATGNLYQCLVDLKLADTVRIVQAGTAAAYGPVTAEQLPVSETISLRPVTAYALSKTTQEQIACMYAAQHGLKIMRARIFNLVGPGQGGHLVPATFIRQLAAVPHSGVLEVGNLSTRRDFVDVRDVAAALERLLVAGEPGSVCNVGSGSSTSIGEVLSMLITMSGRGDVDVRQQPALMRGIDVPDIYADISRIRAMVGWTPGVPLRQTLADMLRAADIEPQDGTQ